MPSLNEEDSISQTIREIPVNKLRRQGWDCELLVVDGGSRDKTVQIAEEQGARVMRSKRGYGRQYLAGFGKARGEIIVTADSDNSYPMNEIPRLVKMLDEKRLDFISTNRFSGIEDGSMRYLNWIGNKALTLAVNFLFDLRLNDSQSGMWVFRKKLLEKLNLKSSGMPLSQEIKIEAFLKSKAREIDSTYRKRKGEAKLRIFQDGWENLIFLLKERFIRAKTIKKFKREVKPADRWSQEAGFGLLAGSVFWILFFLAARNHWGSYWLFVFIFLGLVFFVAGVFCPWTLKTAREAWISFSGILGNLVFKFILYALFYLVATPLGALIRLLGEKSSGSRIDRSVESYWVKKDKMNLKKTSYKRPY